MLLPSDALYVTYDLLESVSLATLHRRAAIVLDT